MSRSKHPSEDQPEHRSCSGAAVRACPTGRRHDGATSGAISVRGRYQCWSRRVSTIGERGAATLLALALSAFVVITALVAVDLGALAVASAQAQTAADLAALAAVTPAGGAPAADRAGQAAAANGARLTWCRCRPMEAVVSVRRRVLLAPFGMPVEVRAYARAVLPGPAMATRSGQGGDPGPTRRR